MRTPASFACCATQSVVTRTSATGQLLSVTRASHLIWTPLPSHAFRERVVRPRRPLVPPLYICGGHGLEVLELYGARKGFAQLGDDVAHALPDEEKFAIA